jgi:inorganic pyrophosphatase
VSPGINAPAMVNAYVEIVPTDAVKYELDKSSGHLRVDRPQRFSSMCPTLYGFIPQTYCGEQVAKLCADRTGATDIKGDGDPMDICVLTEKTFAHGSFFLLAKPIGGLRMIDGHQADDKIIAILDADLAFGHITEISECPGALIDRLKHYFLSYKQLPGDAPRRVEIADVYGRAEATDVITRSMRDYDKEIARK